MSVRSTLNAFNRWFLICGMGSINYNQDTFKMTMVFYILRFTIIYFGFKSIYVANIILAKWVDPYLFDITSVIIMSTFEIIWFAKVVSHVWRIFFDNQLSVVLTKLEATHDKLIHLNVVRPIKIKTKWFVMPGIIGHFISINIIVINALIRHYIYREIQYLTSLVPSFIINACECVAFYEYILLILYIRWMVYIINEQIPRRYSTISTYRDMYLGVIECLDDINISIYGVPAILGFITAYICDTIFLLYTCVIFPQTHNMVLKDQFVLQIITISMKLFSVILLFGVCEATKQEINRMSLVLHQRSMIEKNPRIKRQIKIFILRRLHEHYHFELCGKCEISPRKLLYLLNKAVAYLVIQTLFKLNRKDGNKIN